MDKQNVFCSSQFYMAEGDILHILVKDLTGTMPSIELYDTEDNVEDTYGSNANSIYGALYNWYAATDTRHLANTGWHVPTEAEFQTLITYLGGDAVAGGKLKETGTDYWLTPNTGATNEVAFNARGGGFRHDDGEWASHYFADNEHYIGVYWSTSEDGMSQAMCLMLYHDDIIADLEGANYPGVGGDDPKNNAVSMRLIKDSTALAHGETSTYQGNDSTIYNTVCIGTQEWVAENLKETKFRNGDTIPLVSDATEWNALATTAARCYYKNDINNV